MIDKIATIGSHIDLAICNLILSGAIFQSFSDKSLFHQIFTYPVAVSEEIQSVS